MDAQAAWSARQTEMSNLVEEYQKSGISQNQFFEENNLSKSTFLYWLKKYRTENKQAAGFIPINILSLNSVSDYRNDNQPQMTATLHFSAIYFCLLSCISDNLYILTVNYRT